MKSQVLSLVAISKLKPAKYNPGSRTKQLGSLMKSIEEVGLLVPILVTKHNSVVDGHRRLAACKELGWEEIPCIVVEGDPATLFAHASQNVRKLSGNETLVAYLMEENAIATRMRVALNNAEEVLGRKKLEAMAKRGLSYRTFRIARQIAREADRETPAMLRKATDWLIRYGTGPAVLLGPHDVRTINDNGPDLCYGSPEFGLRLHAVIADGAQQVPCERGKFRRLMDEFKKDYPLPKGCE